MVPKKPIFKGHKKIEETVESLEESVKKESRKPAVTQVVEVVEEVPQQPVMGEESMSAEKPLEEAQPVQAVEAQTPQHPTQPEEGAQEKRMEMVNELFEKKSPKPSGVMPEISMHTKRSTNPIILWALGVIVVCLVVGGALLVFSGSQLTSIVSQPTPTPTPTVKTTPSPTPQAVKREALTIQVLNGGGIAGAASKMKKFLEDKGYTISDTGNTDSYTYDKTEILVKPSKKDFLPLLAGDLKESYTLGTSAASLVESVSYDARVIVGKE